MRGAMGERGRGQAKFDKYETSKRKYKVSSCKYRSEA